MATQPTTVSQPPEVNGVACATCAERVGDCEAVLDSADKTIRLQATTIQGFSAQNERLQKSLDFAILQESRANAWYRDPKLIAPIVFVLGVTLGAYVVRK